METKLSIDGIRLVQTLEEETGSATGYKQCGSITVARTPERLTALRRTADRVRSFGLDAEVVGPEECGRLWTGPCGTELTRRREKCRTRQLQFPGYFPKSLKSSKNVPP